MRGAHLYFDCFSGVAGDMTLGALLDLGVPEAAVRAQLECIPLEQYRLEVTRARRSGIDACDVHVHVASQGHSHRDWREIRTWLERLDGAVQSRAVAIFERIARAEAKIHGVGESEVTFHEVGAVDSVVDVVGTAAALAWLKPARVTARAVPLGHGFVRTAHGHFPVPSPAALEILRGIPTEDGAVEMEMTTPTGAAIVAATASDFGPPPAGKPMGVGYGAGDRDLGDRPNVLRLIVYEAAASAETLLCVAANLDDMNPEWCGVLCEAVFAAGARDVWLEPIVMKKGRPALKLGALCDEAKRDAVLDAILRESTTLGVRFWPVARRALERETVAVGTPYGTLEVKVAREGDRIWNVAPEYESCLAAAGKADVPLKEVYAAAIFAYRSQRGG